MRDPQQRINALNLANAERRAKADLKRAMKSGAVSPLPILLKSEHSFTVEEVLTAIPCVGRVKARKFARAAGTQPHKRLRDLPEIQRKRLAAIVGRWMEQRADKALYGHRYGRGEIAA